MAAPADLPLLTTTGDPGADAVLRGLVGAFESAFPGRVRAYYLTGSHADGTAVATSDLDVGVLFVGELEGDEAARARRLARACAQLSPIELDLTPRGERRALGDVRLKLGSVPIYGEDIRDRVTLPPMALWERVPFYGARRLIARVRGDPDRLVVPLVYPDPAGEFFGYDRRRVRLRDGTVRPTTKDLVRVVTGAAGALASRQTKRYVAGKAEAVRQYSPAVGGAWAPLVEAIDRTCRVEFQYLIPDEAAARARVRGLCGRALGFENRFLEALRDVLLEDLAQPPVLPDAAQWLTVETGPEAPRPVFFLECPPEELRDWALAGLLPATEREGQLLVPMAACLQVAAARMLGRVVYADDPRVGDALAAAASSTVGALRAAAGESLRVWRAETGTRPVL